MSSLATTFENFSAFHSRISGRTHYHSEVDFVSQALWYCPKQQANLRCPELLPVYVVEGTLYFASQLRR